MPYETLLKNKVDFSAPDPRNKIDKFGFALSVLVLGLVAMLVRGMLSRMNGGGGGGMGGMPGGPSTKVRRCKLKHMLKASGLNLSILKLSYVKLR